MNKSYIDNGEKVFVTNEYGELEEREKTTSSEEILVKENVLEEIQNQLDEVENSVTEIEADKIVYLRLLKYFGGLSVICIPILIFLFFHFFEGAILMSFWELGLGYFDCVLSDLVIKANREISIYALQSYFLHQRLNKESMALESLKDKAKEVEEKEVQEVTIKRVNDVKQINQIRNFLIKLREYAGKLKKGCKKHLLSAEEKSRLIEEGIDVELLETYLLTFSNRKK